MIKNGFRTGKKGYRKDLSVMKYNRTDEENINNVVTKKLAVVRGGILLILLKIVNKTKGSFL